MNWLWLVAIALLTLMPLYTLSLLLYRISLSARSVHNQLSETNRLLGELSTLEIIEVDQAVAATASDLDDLVSRRLVLKRIKERRRAARQRRLIARLHEAEEKK
jgi:hypothetical protein